MRLSELGLIGNCQCSALVDHHGRIVWCCLPRFDSEPVFSTLLDEQDGGELTVMSADGAPGLQRYLENTNVLETTFSGKSGSFRVIDFMPRFIQFDRSFRPTKIVRIVEPLDGTPRVRITCRPKLGWSKATPKVDQGSNHLSFHGFGSELRLTTDVPLAYIGADGFALTEKKHLILSFGAPVEEALAPLCERFLTSTVAYWRRWVKHCEIPTMYQAQVIRSALALKLHCFEDTGAIVAAMTTSLPESPGSGRTWDYRYCWLRDAYYAMGAFRLLGHFEEREQFLNYLLNVASSAEGYNLAPLYRIDGKSDLAETIVEGWPGFRGNGPVRVGNGAALHHQHDVFGEMVLALAPLFLDARFSDQRSEELFRLVEGLSRQAIAVAGKPDAGIWELRTEWQPQTFSTLMCWAGVDTMTKIARAVKPALAEEFRLAAERIRAELLVFALHPTRSCLVATHGGFEVDAALLQAATLRLLSPSDPRLIGTVAAIEEDLTHNGWLRRYRTDDGFGEPTVAFVICTFWLVEALSTIGEIGRARALMNRIMAIASPLGLLSEDYDPEADEMWGNFPQAYSHIGLIHAAFAVSPRWWDAG